MSLDELKKKTTCGDCGQLGHWRGDPACRGPNKANETVTIDLADDENPENDDLYYDDVWMEWQDWEQDANEAWTTHSGAADQSSAAYAAQAKKEQKSEHYPELTKPEAEEVIHGVNRIKKKFHSKDSPTETVTPPSKKPMDVFTASALIQHRVEAKKEKEKASAHTATAPEAVREAFDVLGIKPPDTKDSVWGVLNQEAEATFDLDGCVWSWRSHAKDQVCRNSNDLTLATTIMDNSLEYPAACWRTLGSPRVCGMAWRI